MRAGDIAFSQEVDVEIDAYDELRVLKLGLHTPKIDGIAATKCRAIPGRTPGRIRHED